MTAITTSSAFSDNTFEQATRSNSRRKWFFFQAEVTDFDGECHTFELEARNEAEAEAAAVEKSADMGIEADYIFVYKYDF